MCSEMVKKSKGFFEIRKTVEIAQIISSRKTQIILTKRSDVPNESLVLFERNKVFDVRNSSPS